MLDLWIRGLGVNLLLQAISLTVPEKLPILEG